MLETEIFQVNFKVVGLVSIKDNAIRLLVYDNKQTINQTITDLIEDNATIKNQLFGKLINQFDPSKTKVKTDFQRQHETQIETQQQEVENSLSQKQGEKVFAQIKEAYLNSNIIEAPYFELNFKDFFDKNSKEFWIILSELNPHFFNEIKEIIEQKATIDNNIFIIAQSNVWQEAVQYFNEMAMTKPNIFWGEADEIVQTIILSKNGSDKKAILKQTILSSCKTENGFHFFEQDAYFQANEWRSDVSEIYKQYKQALAESYCLIVYNKVKETFKRLSENIEDLTKKQIEDFERYVKKVNVFIHEKEHSQWINDFFKSARESIDSKLKLPLKQHIEREISEIEIKIKKEEANYSISELRAFEDKLQDLKNNLYDENTEGSLKIKNLEDLIKPKIQDLSKLEKKPKTQHQKNNSFKNKR